MIANSFGRGAAARLREWAYNAIRQHGIDGALPTSLRHLYYEAIMDGTISKKAAPPKLGKKGVRRTDQNLTDAVTWLRDHGFVPWDYIDDRTRHVDDYRGDGETVLDGLNAVLDNIRIDPWGAVLPVIVAESESVAGVLVRLANEYRVPIVPTRGQANGWLRTTVADLLGARHIAVCYLGDADKAGADIERNTRNVLNDVTVIKHWQRVALTWEQVEAYGLPTAEREDDRDHMVYEVCEIEALPQRILENDVEAFLRNWLPEGVDLDAVRERETTERAAIRRRLKGWKP